MNVLCGCARLICLSTEPLVALGLQSAAVRTDGSAYSVYVATEELMTNVEVVERLKKNNEAEHAAIDLYQATFFRSVSLRPC